MQKMSAGSDPSSAAYLGKLPLMVSGILRKIFNIFVLDGRMKIPSLQILDGYDYLYQKAERSYGILVLFKVGTMQYVIDTDDLLELHMHVQSR